MEIVIIGLLVVVVIAAVALPLFERARGAHDEHEYGTGAAASTSPEARAAGAEETSPAADRAAAASSGDAQLEAEIARYREAVAAGTLCRHCGVANARDAKFCAECGRPLRAAADAEEYA